MSPIAPRQAGRVVQVGLAAGLVTWRLLSPYTHPWWMDVVLLLALYWIYVVFSLETRHWRAVTLALMVGLLGIYLRGQVPHILVVYDLLP